VVRFFWGRGRGVREPRGRGGGGPALSRRVSEKRVGELGLADSRPAGHEHELALPAGGSRQVLMEARQLGVAPDQESGPRAGRSWRRGRGSRVASRLGGEAIAPAMHSLDETGSFGIVLQPLSYLSDTDGQRRVAHGNPRPDGLP